MSFKSLKAQILANIVIIFLIVSIITIIFTYSTLNNKIDKLSNKFIYQYLLKEKNKIIKPIEIDLTLAQKMVNTEIIKKWVENESDEKLKKEALTELEHYKAFFRSKSYFLVVDKSKNYYYNNEKNEYKGKEYRYTLNPDKDVDQWYFATMKNIDSYILNVNKDEVLKETKIWIDVVIHNDEGKKIGLAGTGFDIYPFLEKFINTNDPYLTNVMFADSGIIQLYKDIKKIKFSTISSKGQIEQTKTIFSIFNIKESKEIYSKINNLKKLPDDIYILNINNSNKLAAISYIPQLQWYIMVILDKNAIFNSKDFMLLSFIFLFALVLMVSIIIYKLNILIINPIKTLENFTKVISKRDYTKQIDLKLNNELGHLATSFNNMVKIIYEHTNNLENLVKERTKEIIQKNKELEIKNKKIIDSINYAKMIQKNILPDEEKLAKATKDFFIIWLPAEIVGGDFYWYRADNDNFYIAVIDCTGHGVPGALITMTANTILNRIIDENEKLMPSQILMKLNKLFKETINKNNTDFRFDDGLEIGLCYINKKKKQLIYSGAGISLYYNENGKIHRIRGEKQGIGYRRTDENIQYANTIIQISEDKVFYMATDGYEDQNGSINNIRFGRKNFIKIIEENYYKDLKEQKKIFLEKLEEHKKDKPQRDDITILAFKL